MLRSLQWWVMSKGEHSVKMKGLEFTVKKVKPRWYANTGRRWLTRRKTCVSIFSNRENHRGSLKGDDERQCVSKDAKVLQKVGVVTQSQTDLVLGWRTNAYERRKSDSLKRANALCWLCGDHEKLIQRKVPKTKVCKCLYPTSCWG